MYLLWRYLMICREIKKLLTFPHIIRILTKPKNKDFLSDVTIATALKRDTKISSGCNYTNPVCTFCNEITLMFLYSWEKNFVNVLNSKILLYTTPIFRPHFFIILILRLCYGICMHGSLARFLTYHLWNNFGVNGCQNGN